MKTKTRHPIPASAVIWDRSFPSGLWIASAIYRGYFVRGRGDTKAGALAALRSTALRSTALRSTALRSTALRSTALRSAAVCN
jgi:hypothetical protein